MVEVVELLSPADVASAAIIELVVTTFVVSKTVVRYRVGSGRVGEEEKGGGRRRDA